MSAALDYFLSLPGIAVALLVVFLFNALAVSGSFLKWENLYFGLPTSVASAVLLMGYANRRWELLNNLWAASERGCSTHFVNLNPQCGIALLRLFSAVGPLLVTFFGLIFWVGIFAVQIAWRREYAKAPIPERHIFLAGWSNVLGISAYILFRSMLDATMITR